MMGALVSIITPCYNSEKTIERTIQSVLSQTYQNIEYIIVDGASTDNTLNIVKKYEKLFAGRMTVISEKDNGIYDAMNKGISLAKGELVGIINSDDHYELDAVENAVQNMEEDRYQVLYGLLRYTKQGEEVSVVLYNHNFLNQQMITHPTCFVTKKAYEDLGVYNCKYRSCADYELMLRWWKDKRVRFKQIYKIISNFELGGMSSTDYAMKEGARLKREYGLISRFSYYRIIMNATLHSLYVKYLKN